MARIRYIKPDFFTDEELAELPFVTRLTYAGLWCHADKAGRLEDRPKYLKAVIWPYDNVDMEKQLEALSKPKRRSQRPFIVRYEVEGITLIQIVRWSEHQKPHNTEADSKLPPIPPLNGDGKGNGEGKLYIRPLCVPLLSNGEVPVKEPLTLGSFGNVRMTEDELGKLRKRFGSELTDDLIESLSEYMASKGRKYKSHYATILSWTRRKDEANGHKETGSPVRRALAEFLNEEDEPGGDQDAH